MHMFAFKLPRGGIGFAYCGGWRFDAYTQWSLIVGKFDWSAVPRNTALVLTEVKRPSLYERVPTTTPEVAMFRATYAGRDARGRPLIFSRANCTKRLAPAYSLFAFGENERQVMELHQFVAARKASDRITRMIVGID